MLEFQLGKASTPDSSPKSGTSSEGSADRDDRDVNSYDHGLSLGLKRRRDDPAGGLHKRPKPGINGFPNSVDEAMAKEWVSMMQPLIKGKVEVNKKRLYGLSDLLCTIDGLKDRVDEHVLEATRLRQSVIQLSELQDIPFGDEHGLRGQALALREYWSSTRRKAETVWRLD